MILLSLPISLSASVLFSGANSGLPDYSKNKAGYSIVERNTNSKSESDSYSTYSKGHNASKQQFDFIKRIIFIAKFIHSRIASVDDEHEKQNLVSEFEKISNFKEFEVAAVYFFENNTYQASEKLLFIDLILSSDINIFSKWFKNILILGSKSNNKTLSFVSNDLLSYYSNSFKNIE